MTREEAIERIRQNKAAAEFYAQLVGNSKSADNELKDIEAFNMAIKALSEPKTGEWIEAEVIPEVYDIEGVKTWGSKMQCDQCGFIFTAVEGHIRQYNYCPNCGAKMKGADDEHDK